MNENLILFSYTEGNCRNLTHLENGHIVVNGTTYYSRAYYHCDEGFSNFPAGAFYRGCGGHGWVGIVPECGEYVVSMSFAGYL